MAGVNIGNVGLTFTKFLDGVVETLNHTSKSRNLVSKGKPWSGSHIEGKIHVGRSTAIGYVEDGGAFPIADKQDYVAYKAARKFIVGSIQLTDGAMATAAKSPQVARDVITSEVQGMMNNILKFENGFFFRDGSGTVATLTDGMTAGQTTDIQVDDARMLWDGGTYTQMPADMLTTDGDVTVANVESALHSSGDALINTSTGLPVLSAASDVLVWKGAANRAITGLDKLIDDSASTFQDVDVAAYPRYGSLVLDNGGTNRALSPGLFRSMLAGLMAKSGSERPSDGLKVLCNSWQAINVEELYEGDLRLTPDSKVGGMSVASFQSSLGRVDIMVDTDCLYNKMFFCDFSKIHRAVQKQLGWRREGGSIFKRSDVAGVWTATALEIAELYIKERHTSGKIADLTEAKVTAY